MNWRNLESNKGQRGEGRMKAIIYTLIFLMAIYVAWKVVPVYVDEYQLKDKISEQARFAVVNRYSEDQIRDIIYKTIEDLDIPAKREDIKVEQTHHGIQISVNYSVPLDLKFYKTQLNFSPSSEGIDILK